MRTNFAGLALAVGMGLIVLLMGFAALSAAGLVGFAADESFAVRPTAIPDSTFTDTAQPVSSYVPASSEEASAIAAGDALFKNNCAQCHAVNDKIVGPALAGITKRRRISWLIPWVKNSSKVIASGDEYAVKLFNDNSKQQMPAFPQLSDKDVKDIMVWVTSQEGRTASSALATAY